MQQLGDDFDLTGRRVLIFAASEIRRVLDVDAMGVLLLSVAVARGLHGARPERDSFERGSPTCRT